VLAGSDCGFAPFAIVWAKPGVMAEGARLAFAELW
jgi:hypothetical protein